MGALHAVVRYSPGLKEHFVTGRFPMAAKTSRRRNRRRPLNAAVTAVQDAFGPRARAHATVPLLDEESIERIHQASLQLLAETGLRVLHDKARSIMQEHGADVDENTQTVRFDADLIEQHIKTIPSEFTLHARNPEHSVVLGNDTMVNAVVASAPNCSDLDQGRRTGNRHDYQNFLRLGQYHNILHVFGGYPVEPVDIHASIRHLDCISDLLTLTDKAFCIYSLGEQRVLDAIEMTRIAHGLTPEDLKQQACLFTVINTNSPLQLDIPMMQGVYDMARHGQPVVVTPFTLAGAMAPVTLAGAITLQNAEALATLAFSQMVQPGAPAMYGGFTSNVDMKSGSPAFGTPEYIKAQLISGQLARRYNIPFRTSNVCAANTVDAQAAYESTISLWGAVNSGGHLLMHGAGWLEGGLCASFEKLVLDVDLLQMIAEMQKPVTVTDEDLALSAIAEVGPGGHFFGVEHTQSRYKSAFYAPVLSDWRNFESWQEAGSPTAIDKANIEWKKRLALYEQPPMDAGIREELAAFVDRRKAEGGVPTDF